MSRIPKRDMTSEDSRAGGQEAVWAAEANGCVSSPFFLEAY